MEHALKVGAEVSPALVGHRADLQVFFDSQMTEDGTSFDDLNNPLTHRVFRRDVVDAFAGSATPARLD